MAIFGYSWRFTKLETISVEYQVIVSSQISFVLPFSFHFRSGLLSSLVVLLLSMSLLPQFYRSFRSFSFLESFEEIFFYLSIWVKRFPIKDRIFYEFYCTMQIEFLENFYPDITTFSFIYILKVAYFTCNLYLWINYFIEINQGINIAINSTFNLFLGIEQKINPLVILYF